MAEKREITVDKIREISNFEDLSKIRHLRLSKQGISTISPKILSQLTSLEELNLSNNSFENLELKDICLPSLTTLNMANNHLVTLDGFTAFPNMKDLNISNNPKIEVSDKYKLVSVCPLLKILDGKDVQMMRDAVTRLDTTLMSKVAEMWKENFEDQYNQLDDKGDTGLKEDYIEKLKTEVTCGPPMLKVYREFRLSVLGQDYLQKIQEKSKEETRRKKIKTTVNGELGIDHTRLEDSDDECKKEWLGIRDCQGKSSKQIKESGSPDAQFVVSHLLQTHSLNNDPEDRKTQVWGCQFEPDPERPGETTAICATCGGDSVCFIDCSTGQVMKKYKQPGETFYCIAWTTVTMDLNGNKRKANLLAAGGSQKDIKIIEPTQLVCCEEITGLRGVLEYLLFHPVISSWLLCAADETVTLWELGLSKGTEFGNKSKLLLTLKSRTIVRSFAIPPHGKVVVGACDDGCYLWRINDMDSDKPRSPFGKLEFTGKKNIPLDCVQCLSDSLVATKRVEEGYICVWRSESNMIKNDFTLVLKVPWRKTETPFLKFCYIPACEVLVAGDDEGCVWLYDIRRYTTSTEKETTPQKLEIMQQTQVLLCPNDSTKVFNQVCANTSLEYIVAVADTNVVCMWRRVKAGEA